MGLIGLRGPDSPAQWECGGGLDNRPGDAAYEADADGWYDDWCLGCGKDACAGADCGDWPYVEGADPGVYCPFSLPGPIDCAWPVCIGFNDGGFETCAENEDGGPWLTWSEDVRLGEGRGPVENEWHLLYIGDGLLDVSIGFVVLDGWKYEDDEVGTADGVCNGGGPEKFGAEPRPSASCKDGSDCRIGAAVDGNVRCSSCVVLL